MIYNNFMSMVGRMWIEHMTNGLRVRSSLIINYFNSLKTSLQF